MTDLLIDSDIFIDHIRGRKKLSIGRQKATYSVVTRCELFAGKHADEDGIRLLLGAFRELPVDRETAELAGRLRRKHDARTADALIAATALQHDLKLLTRNLRDFERVPKLKVRNPVP